MSAGFTRVAAVVIACELSVTVQAQFGDDYSLTWYTVDGGAATFADGGDYEAGATVGQADVGRQTGGQYTLQGGFWVAASAMLCMEDEDCDDGDICTWDRCIDGTCSNTPNAYGDVNHNGAVNVLDIFCILDAMAGDFTNCSFRDADIDPCEPNGVLNLFDIFAVLDSIAGDDHCCEGLP